MTEQADATRRRSVHLLRVVQVLSIGSTALVFVWANSYTIAWTTTALALHAWALHRARRGQLEVDQLPDALPSFLHRERPTRAVGALHGIALAYEVVLENSLSWRAVLFVELPVRASRTTTAKGKHPCPWLPALSERDLQPLLPWMDTASRRAFGGLLDGGWRLAGRALRLDVPLGDGQHPDLDGLFAAPVAVLSAWASEERGEAELLVALATEDPDPAMQLAAVQALTDDELSALPPLAGTLARLEVARRLRRVDALQAMSAHVDPEVQRRARDALRRLATERPALSGAVAIAPATTKGAVSLLDPADPM